MDIHSGAGKDSLLSSKSDTSELGLKKLVKWITLLEDELDTRGNDIQTMRDQFEEQASYLEAFTKHQVRVLGRQQTQALEEEKVLWRYRTEIAKPLPELRSKEGQTRARRRRQHSNSGGERELWMAQSKERYHQEISELLEKCRSKDDLAEQLQTKLVAVQVRYEHLLEKSEHTRTEEMRRAKCLSKRIEARCLEYDQEIADLRAKVADQEACMNFFQSHIKRLKEENEVLRNDTKSEDARVDERTVDNLQEEIQQQKDLATQSELVLQNSRLEKSLLQEEVRSLQKQTKRESLKHDLTKERLRVSEQSFTRERQFLCNEIDRLNLEVAEREMRLVNKESLIKKQEEYSGELFNELSDTKKQLAGVGRKLLTAMSLAVKSDSPPVEKLEKENLLLRRGRIGEVVGSAGIAHPVVGDEKIQMTSDTNDKLCTSTSSNLTPENGARSSRESTNSPLEDDPCVTTDIRSILGIYSCERRDSYKLANSVSRMEKIVHTSFDTHSTRAETEEDEDEDHVKSTVPDSRKKRDPEQSLDLENRDSCTFLNKQAAAIIDSLQGSLNDLVVCDQQLNIKRQNNSTPESLNHSSFISLTAAEGKQPTTNSSNEAIQKNHELYKEPSGSGCTSNQVNDVRVDGKTTDFYHELHKEPSRSGCTSNQVNVVNDVHIDGEITDLYHELYKEPSRSGCTSNQVNGVNDVRVDGETTDLYHELYKEPSHSGCTSNQVNVVNDVRVDGETTDLYHELYKEPSRSGCTSNQVNGVNGVCVDGETTDLYRESHKEPSGNCYTSNQINDVNGVRVDGETTDLYRESHKEPSDSGCTSNQINVDKVDGETMKFNSGSPSKKNNCATVKFKQAEREDATRFMQELDLTRQQSNEYEHRNNDNGITIDETFDSPSKQLLADSLNKEHHNKSMTNVKSGHLTKSPFNTVDQSRTDQNDGCDNLNKESFKTESGEHQISKVDPTVAVNNNEFGHVYQIEEGEEEEDETSNCFDWFEHNEILLNQKTTDGSNSTRASSEICDDFLANQCDGDDDDTSKERNTDRRPDFNSTIRDSSLSHGEENKGVDDNSLCKEQNKSSLGMGCDGMSKESSDIVSAGSHDKQDKGVDDNSLRKEQNNSSLGMGCDGMSKESSDIVSAGSHDKQDNGGVEDESNCFDWFDQNMPDENDSPYDAASTVSIKDTIKIRLRSRSTSRDDTATDDEIVNSSKSENCQQGSCHKSHSRTDSSSQRSRSKSDISKPKPDKSSPTSKSESNASSQKSLSKSDASSSKFEKLRSDVSSLRSRLNSDASNQRLHSKSDASSQRSHPKSDSSSQKSDSSSQILKSKSIVSSQKSHSKSDISIIHEVFLRLNSKTDESSEKSDKSSQRSHSKSDTPSERINSKKTDSSSQRSHPKSDSSSQKSDKPSQTSKSKSNVSSQKSHSKSDTSIIHEIFLRLNSKTDASSQKSDNSSQRSHPKSDVSSHRSHPKSDTSSQRLNSKTDTSSEKSDKSSQRSHPKYDVSSQKLNTLPPEFNSKSESISQIENGAPLHESTNNRNVKEDKHGKTSSNASKSLTSELSQLVELVKSNKCLSFEWFEQQDKPDTYADVLSNDEGVTINENNSQRIESKASFGLQLSDDKISSEQLKDNSNKCSEPRSAESNKCSEPRSAESNKCSEPRSAESNKCSEPRSAERNKCSEPRSAESNKSSEPGSAESNKWSEPRSAESNKSSEPRSAESNKCSEPRSAESNKWSEPRSAESNKCSEPRSAESNTCSEPRSAESNKCSEPRSAESNKWSEPRSAESNKCSEPRSAESNKSSEPGSAESNKWSEPRSAESNKSSEPRSAESNKCSEPRSAESNKWSEPRSAESNKCSEPRSAESNTCSEPRSAESNKCSEPRSAESNKWSEPRSAESNKCSEPRSAESNKSSEPRSAESNKCSEPRSAESNKWSEPRSAESNKCSEPRSAESNTCSEPRSAESNKCSEPRSAESNKWSEPRSAESNKCSEPRSAESNKSSEPRSAESNKCSEPRSAESNKSSEPRSAESNKCSEPRSAERNKCSEARSAESNKCSEPRSAESNKCSEPRSAESNKWSEPRSAERNKCSEPRSAESNKWSEPRSAESNKCSEPRPAERNKCSEPRSAESNKCSEPGSAESNKWSEPRSAESNKCSEPRSAERNKWSEPRSAESNKWSEPRSAESNKSSEPRSAESNKCSEPRSAESNKCSEPRSAESNKSSESKKVNSNTFSEPDKSSQKLKSKSDASTKRSYPKSDSSSQKSDKSSQILKSKSIVSSQKSHSKSDISIIHEIFLRLNSKTDASSQKSDKSSQRSHSKSNVSSQRSHPKSDASRQKSTTLPAEFNLKSESISQIENGAPLHESTNNRNIKEDKHGKTSSSASKSLTSELSQLVELVKSISQPVGSKTSSESQPVGSKTSSELQPAGSKTSSELQKAGSKTSSESQKAGSKTSSKLQPAGSKISSELQKAGSKRSSESQPAGSKISSELQEAGSKTSSKSQPAGSKISSELQKAGSKTSSELQKAGSKTSSESQPAGSKISSELQPAGSKISSKSQPAGSKISSELQKAGSKTSSESQPAGSKTSSKSQPAGSKISSELQKADDKTSSKSKKTDINYKSSESMKTDDKTSCEPQKAESKTSSELNKVDNEADNETQIQLRKVESSKMISGSQCDHREEGHGKTESNQDSKDSYNSEDDDGIRTDDQSFGSDGEFPLDDPVTMRVDKRTGKVKLKKKTKKKSAKKKKKNDEPAPTIASLPPLRGSVPLLLKMSSSTSKGVLVPPTSKTCLDLLMSQKPCSSTNNNNNNCSIQGILKRRSKSSVVVSDGLLAGSINEIQQTNSKETISPTKADKPMETETNDDDENLRIAGQTPPNRVKIKEPTNVAFSSAVEGQTPNSEAPTIASLPPLRGSVPLLLKMSSSTSKGVLVPPTSKTCLDLLMSQKPCSSTNNNNNNCSIQGILKRRSKSSVVVSDGLLAGSINEIQQTNSKETISPTKADKPKETETNDDDDDNLRIAGQTPPNRVKNKEPTNVAFSSAVEGQRPNSQVKKENDARSSMVTGQGCHHNSVTSRDLTGPQNQNPSNCLLAQTSNILADTLDGKMQLQSQRTEPSGEPDDRGQKSTIKNYTALDARSVALQMLSNERLRMREGVIHDGDDLDLRSVALQMPSNEVLKIAEGVSPTLLLISSSSSSSVGRVLGQQNSSNEILATEKSLIKQKPLKLQTTNDTVEVEGEFATRSISTSGQSRSPVITVPIREGGSIKTHSRLSPGEDLLVENEGELVIACLNQSSSRTGGEGFSSETRLKGSHRSIETLNPLNENTGNIERTESANSSTPETISSGSRPKSITITEDIESPSEIMSGSVNNNNNISGHGVSNFQDNRYNGDSGGGGSSSGGGGLITRHQIHEKESASHGTIYDIVGNTDDRDADDVVESGDSNEEHGMFEVNPNSGEINIDVSNTNDDNTYDNNRSVSISYVSSISASNNEFNTNSFECSIRYSNSYSSNSRDSNSRFSISSGSDNNDNESSSSDDDSNGGLDMQGVLEARDDHQDQHHQTHLSEALMFIPPRGPSNPMMLPQVVRSERSALQMVEPLNNQQQQQRAIGVVRVQNNHLGVMEVEPMQSQNYMRPVNSQRSSMLRNVPMVEIAPNVSAIQLDSNSNIAENGAGDSDTVEENLNSVEIEIGHISDDEDDGLC